MDFGLMKMAMGYSCACCNLLIALPDTSRMQCFPWKGKDQDQTYPRSLLRAENSLLIQLRLQKRGATEMKHQS